MGVLASSEPDTVSAARFTTNARVGAPVIVSREAELDRLRAVVANSGVLERGRRPARHRDRARHAGRRGRGARRRARAGGGGVDRRDRHRAAARARCSRGVRAACAALGDDADDFSKAILTSDAGPEARLPRGRRCRRARVRLAAQAKGAGHDLAALRDDVLLRPDRRRARAAHARPAHRRVRQALVRPHQRRRPALHQRHGLRAGERRLRRARGAASRRTSSRSARRSTRCCASSRSRSSPTARARSRVGRIVVSGRPDAVEPVARSIANSPLVKTALHGGDPNFGRILQAAGQVVAARRRRSSPTSRSRAARWSRRATRSSADCRRWSS